MWLGSLLVEYEDAGEIQLTWRWGFLERVVLGCGIVEHDGIDVLVGLSLCNAAKFIRELRIGALIANNRYTKIVSAMGKQGLPKTLKRLEIDTSEMTFCDLGKLDVLYPALDHVTEVALTAPEMNLGNLVLKGTKTLEITAAPLLAKHLKSLASGSCPKLTTLHLDFGNKEARWLDPAPATDLAAVLDAAAGYPALETLRLWHSRTTDEYAFLLPTRKILPQLKELDLSRGLLTDRGAATFIEHHSLFKHLKKIDLSRNLLTPTMTQRLKKTYAKVVDVTFNNPKEPSRSERRASGFVE